MSDEIETTEIKQEVGRDDNIEANIEIQPVEKTPADVEEVPPKAEDTLNTEENKEKRM